MLIPVLPASHPLTRGSHYVRCPDMPAALSSTVTVYSLPRKPLPDKPTTSLGVLYGTYGCGKDGNSRRSLSRIVVSAFHWSTRHSGGLGGGRQKPFCGAVTVKRDVFRNSPADASMIRRQVSGSIPPADPAWTHIPWRFMALAWGRVCRRPHWDCYPFYLWLDFVWVEFCVLAVLDGIYWRSCGVTQWFMGLWWYGTSIDAYRGGFAIIFSREYV